MRSILRDDGKCDTGFIQHLLRDDIERPGRHSSIYYYWTQSLQHKVWRWGRHRHRNENPGTPREEISISIV